MRKGVGGRGGWEGGGGCKGGGLGREERVVSDEGGGGKERDGEGGV